MLPRVRATRVVVEWSVRPLIEETLDARTLDGRLKARPVAAGMIIKSPQARDTRTGRDGTSLFADVDLESRERLTDVIVVLLLVERH